MPARKPTDRPDVRDTAAGATDGSSTEAVDQATQDAGESTESTDSGAEQPLNRAERRARRKGGSKPETSGGFPVAQQNVRRDNPAHTRRQWATRRSG